MDEKLLQILMATFQEEFREQVALFEELILKLERETAEADAVESVKELFRIVHSMKGAAGSVDIQSIQKVAHQLESVFSAIQEQALQLDGTLIQLFLESADLLKIMLERLRAGEELDQESIAPLLAKLQQVLAGKNPDPKPALQKPEPEPDPKPKPKPNPAPAPQVADKPVVEVKPSETSALHAEDDIINVSSARIKRMAALGGELLVAQRRLSTQTKSLAETIIPSRKNSVSTASEQANAARFLATIERQLAELSIASRRLEQIAAPLETEILQTCMIRFSEACLWLPRTIRDLAHDAGKQVDCVVHGGDIELDRSVADMLKDPLRHIIRNAVDHGIELPAERTRENKPASGRIDVTAEFKAGRIEITVSDDGRGFDLDKIRATARKKAFAVPDQQDELLNLIFEPGFSTVASVTNVSGRGVGLDAVRTTLEAIGGSVTASMQETGGSLFILSAPVNLSRLDALLIRAGEQIYAVDCATVTSLSRITIEELGLVNGQSVLKQSSGPIPAFFLSQILQQKHPAKTEPEQRIPVIVLKSGNQSAAFLVDELLAVQDVVIKDFSECLEKVQNFSGATLLEDGNIGLILNSMELLRTAIGGDQHQHGLALAATSDQDRTLRLLVADDTATTRILIQSILETAGFAVSAAADGAQALELLNNSDFDLVVSDVDMPVMSGIKLTELIRASSKLHNIPVILLTGLGSEQDKLQGMEAGADAYLIKSSFDQSELLKTIKQLL